jgi:hypothetical protein
MRKKRHWVEVHHPRDAHGRFSRVASTAWISKLSAAAGGLKETGTQLRERTARTRVAASTGKVKLPDRREGAVGALRDTLARQEVSANLGKTAVALREGARTKTGAMSRSVGAKADTLAAEKLDNTASELAAGRITIAQAQRAIAEVRISAVTPKAHRAVLDLEQDTAQHLPTKPLGEMSGIERARVELLGVEHLLPTEASSTPVVKKPKTPTGVRKPRPAPAPAPVSKKTGHITPQQWAKTPASDRAAALQFANSRVRNSQVGSDEWLDASATQANLLAADLMPQPKPPTAKKPQRGRPGR